MSAPISLESGLKKFALLYSTVMTVAVFVTVLVFNIYVSYILNVVKDVSHNAVMINDTFSLKQGVAPLVSGDIQSIQIFNSENKSIFFHEQNDSAAIKISKHFKVYDRENLIYSIKVQLSILNIILILVALGSGLLFLYRPFVKYEKKEIFHRTNESIADMSKKLAHDIRTPISTLSLISAKINDSEIKDLQLSVVKQINLIAEDLLKYSRDQMSDNFVPARTSVASFKGTSIKINERDNDNVAVEGIPLSGFISEIVAEYQLKKKKSNCEIKLSNPNFNAKLGLEHAKTLYPIICNCINNSIEAIYPNFGLIEIAINSKVEQRKASEDESKDQLIQITIVDNGKGIEPNVLEGLGQRQFSTKPNNNGIALFNARKSLKTINGNIKFESEVNKFTKVIISFLV